MFFLKLFFNNCRVDNAVCGVAPALLLPDDTFSVFELFYKPINLNWLTVTFLPSL